MSSATSQSGSGQPAGTKPKSSAASRYFFVFLVGLVLGAIGVVMLMRAWEARKTWQDKWHDALMEMNQVHVARLGGSVEQNRCAATDLLPHLQALRVLANDLEPAFPELADDQRFKDHASKYRAALDDALANPPLNCAGAGTTQQAIGEACKACHQDFRG